MAPEEEKAPLSVPASSSVFQKKETKVFPLFPPRRFPPSLHASLPPFLRRRRRRRRRRRSVLKKVFHLVPRFRFWESLAGRRGVPCVGGCGCRRRSFKCGDWRVWWRSVGLGGWQGPGGERHDVTTMPFEDERKKRGNRPWQIDRCLLSYTWYILEESPPAPSLLLLLLLLRRRAGGWSRRG